MDMSFRAAERRFRIRTEDDRSDKIKEFLYKLDKLQQEYDVTIISDVTYGLQVVHGYEESESNEAPEVSMIE